MDGRQEGRNEGTCICGGAWRLYISQPSGLQVAGNIQYPLFNKVKPVDLGVCLGQLKALYFMCPYSSPPLGCPSLTSLSDGLLRFQAWLPSCALSRALRHRNFKWQRQGQTPGLLLTS